MRTGVDLLDIARFARIAAHPGGCRLVFTPAELARAASFAATRRTEYLACRFCAKEATAKALGRGLGQGLVWQDIEVSSDEHGAPMVSLSGGALRLAREHGISRVDVSLAHQGGMVVCFALAS